MGYYQRVGDDIVPLDVTTASVEYNGDDMESQRLQCFCDTIHMCTEIIKGSTEWFRLAMRRIDLEAKIKMLEQRAG